MYHIYKTSCYIDCISLYFENHKTTAYSWSRNDNLCIGPFLQQYLTVEQSFVSPWKCNRIQIFLIHLKVRFRLYILVDEAPELLHRSNKYSLELETVPEKYIHQKNIIEYFILCGLQIMSFSHTCYTCTPF